MVCECDYCKLARRIKAEQSNWTPETLEIVRELWRQWEHADEELTWQQMPKNELVLTAGERI